MLTFAVAILIPYLVKYVYFSGTNATTKQSIHSQSKLNWPSKIEHFIGRDQEISNLTNILESDIRIVIIVGTPGVGKSTLAIHMADVMSSKGMNIHFVDLYQVFRSRGMNIHFVDIYQVFSLNCWKKPFHYSVLKNSPKPSKFEHQSTYHIPTSPMNACKGTGACYRRLYSLWSLGSCCNVYTCMSVCMHAYESERKGIMYLLY